MLEAGTETEQSSTCQVHRLLYLVNSCLSAWMSWTPLQNPLHNLELRTEPETQMTGQSMNHNRSACSEEAAEAVAKVHSHFVLFFNFYLFIYLFLAVLGLRFCARAFSSCGKWGPLFIAARGPLIIAASLVAEHRLQRRRLSSCGARA